MYKDDLQNYFLGFLTKKNKLSSKRDMSKGKTIILWNNFYKARLHQGRYKNELHQTKYHLGFKFGQFTKTRKPFFFRGKKK